MESFDRLANGEVLREHVTRLIQQDACSRSCLTGKAYELELFISNLMEITALECRHQRLRATSCKCKVVILLAGRAEAPSKSHKIALDQALTQQHGTSPASSLVPNFIDC
ncbi:hypothetical protein PybrP1_010755 [[Pythium] brassicae (nom. inval.)]|nr:hypothetical protein PybrP1_010755 [[Pythium] brassicae (nom. inval.)]